MNREENFKKIQSVFKDLPSIDTERLLLRKMTKRDAMDLFEYASDPEVTKYVTWDYHRSIADSRFFLNLILKQYENSDVGPWGIVHKEDRKLIGTCGYAWWIPDHNRAEFGYALSRKYWNKGLMTEAVKRIIQFGFEIMNLNRIEARCKTDNAASEKVMIKCGMTFEGTMRQQMYVKGEYHDLKMYSLLKSDFETVH